jgi:serine/threonine-protein kinase
MNDTRLPKIVYFLMLLMGLLEWMHAYPQLPDRMASHFDFYGRPDGWQPKEAFFLVMAVVVVMTGLTGFLVPVVLAAAPTEFINVPRRDYWLAPGRREETFRFLRTHLEWFA